ncbi:MAG TPA: FAD-dependent oxidoreductase, partial [Prolixibacteraceae bacterium]
MAINTQHIIIIGGGPAGLEAASTLGAAGYIVTVFEKEEQTGGKLRLWYKLFPGFRSAVEVKEYLSNGQKMNPPQIITNAEVVSVTPEIDYHKVVLADGQIFKADVVLIATGFRVFTAERKEEYGYKIYDNVITSVDLETLLKSGTPVKTVAGKTPHRIAFIHCVGSRD